MAEVLAEYMTRAELAAELHLCTRTLNRWCALGEGPPVTRIGKRPYYNRASGAAWLASKQEAQR